ncbi:hypothetical protein H4582DRAFT_2075253 [Lactarius indigo]|nr:hypothetical protein H4582DRAFT_2075253 [Lactarius indigo]
MSNENTLGTLVVVVLKAQHLIDNHTFYKQDPYAKLSLSGGTKQTPPDPKGGQHPVWDAELRFPISKDASKNNRTLTISVFAEERKDDELLGEGTIDITNTLKTGEFDDWVPLSLKGTQRGEVYLEMTFFASGPAPLTRRPTKFKNPSERLGRPQQPVAQRPQRVTSQPSPTALTPQGQQGPRASSQDVRRQGPPKAQQVPLPGGWPGPSAQHKQLPPEPEPKQEFVPSALRPGGPSRTGNTSPNTYPSQPAHQNSSLLPGSLAPQGHISSSSPQLEAQPQHARRVSSYSGQGSPGYGEYGPSGHVTTQPSPQTQPEAARAHHNLSLQPSPQQHQRPASQPAPYVSPYPPNNHSAAQTYATPPASTPPVQSYAATQSPAPSTFSYLATPAPGPGPVPPTQPHAATSSPVPPAHSQATNISAAPPSPPSQLYPVTSGPPSRPPVTTSSPAPGPHLYTASPIPFTSPYPGSPAPHTQPYLSPLGPVLAPPGQSHFTPPSSPPLPQSYFSPSNSLFPLPTSPPPIPSYGHSYEPPTVPSFPAPSFPVPQSTIDYFGSAATSPPPQTPFSAPHVDEPELPDPYLLKRYQTPLPLPPGSSRTPSAQPKPPAPAPAPAATTRQDENERVARELQRREEVDSARTRREQEERDAELARSLDRELNLDGGGGGGGAGEDRPLPPPRRAESIGGHRSAMPGAW